MSKETNTQLSRRELEIMDVIYRSGRATAAEVLDQLAEPPSYSAVRALLRVLEDKGHLRHEQDGPRYVFLPTVPATKPGRRPPNRPGQRSLRGRPARPSARSRGSQGPKPSSYAATGHPSQTASPGRRRQRQL